MILHQQALENLAELGLDDEARDVFLGANARRLIGVSERVEASAR